MSQDRDRGRESNRLIYLGLIGVAVTAVMQMLDKFDAEKPLTPPLLTGAFIFAATIPLLCGLLLVDSVRPARTGSATAHRRDIVGLIVGVITLVGVSMCFFHLGVSVGVVFVVGVVVSLTLLPRL